MDWKTDIEAIKARAFAVRWTLSKLCEEAGIANNSFWRWDNGVNEPTATVIGRLEDALDRRERERAAS